MTAPISMAEYFATEAGEYLDRLRGLAERPNPAPEELVRYSRALRGAALMANQQLVARAAAGLEALAKGVREGRRPWDPGMANRFGGAVTELRELVRTAATWEDEQLRQAERLAQELEAHAGIASGGGPRGYITTPGTAPGSEAGVRAFIAREGALAASALDRASRALRSTPNSHEPLYAVLRRLQSLRGLAALTDLAPLPEMLDAIERAVGELTRMFAPPPRIADVFELAAQALSRTARDVAQSGRPDMDAQEPRLFAELLLETFATERDVVPIESLFFAPAEGVVQLGMPPKDSPLAQLSTVELVSHGEHLVQAADDLDQAATDTTRDLQLFAMLSSLRALEIATGERVPSRLAAFAHTARELIATGEVARDQREFSACLREMGGQLRIMAGNETPSHPDAEIEKLIHRLQRIGGSLLGVVEVTPSAPVGLAPEPGEPEGEVVEIDELLMETAGTATPVEAAAPPREPGLAGSYVTYEWLVEHRGAGEPSLDALLQRTPSATVPQPGPFAEGEVVEITELVYRGQAAYDRAAEVRREIDALIRQGAGGAPMKPLLDELLDLVSLAIPDAR